VKFFLANRFLLNAYSIWTILIFALFSCNKNQEEIQREEQSQMKTEKVGQLAAKYSALSDWNKLEYKYSYELEEFIFSGGGKIALSDYIQILDVYKSGESYFLIGTNRNGLDNVLFEVEIDPALIPKLLSSIEDNFDLPDIVFIIEVSTVRKLIDESVLDEWVIIEIAKRLRIEGNLIGFEIIE
jgi:hypothetical protein